MISTLFLTGLLGSLGHCLGMCGPLVLLVGAHFGQVSFIGRLSGYLLYHGARILVYALLGMLMGAIGSLMGFGGNFTLISAIISIFLGVGVILLSLGYLGVGRIGNFQVPTGWTMPVMNKAFQHGGPLGVLTLGAINGLLPCGLVYGALLMSTSAGSPAKGSLGMVAFGLGTLSALLVLGMGAASLPVRARQVMLRVAGFLILLVGLQLILRGMAEMGWIMHWMIGSLMIY